MNAQTYLRKLGIGLAGFAGLLVSGWAQAVVLYDESVSGDLATFDTTTINLVSGANSVLGSAAFSITKFDSDGFLVNLGAGLTLSDIEYFISNVSVASDTTSLSTRYGMKTPDHSGTLMASTSVNVLGGSPQDMFASALPVTGAFAFGTTPQVTSRVGGGGSWDYEIRLTVVPESSTVVPEPITLLLLGLGIVGLGFARKRVY